MENVESAQLVAVILDEKVAPFAFEDALQEFFLYLRGDGDYIFRWRLVQPQ